ncbi:unnamed protein product [Fraxinus pennsylvanica]|uniref:Uncharacterized protein n=1 Tax=Fraxinus pennsylvanica TaxID=56036 RepID=A0AAD2DTR0_9LAMI|nr:unnamed protein product [Fraxinus pennsylvanica]
MESLMVHLEGLIDTLQVGTRVGIIKIAEVKLGVIIVDSIHLKVGEHRIRVLQMVLEELLVDMELRIIPRVVNMELVAEARILWAVTGTSSMDGHNSNSRF